MFTLENCCTTLFSPDFVTVCSQCTSAYSMHFVDSRPCALLTNQYCNWSIIKTKEIIKQRSWNTFFSVCNGSPYKNFLALVNVLVFCKECRVPKGDIKGELKKISFFGRFFGQLLNNSESVTTNYFTINVARDILQGYTYIKFEVIQNNRFRNIDIGSWLKKTAEKRTGFFIRPLSKHCEEFHNVTVNTDLFQIIFSLSKGLDMRRRKCWNV